MSNYKHNNPRRGGYRNKKAESNGRVVNVKRPATDSFRDNIRQNVREDYRDTGGRDWPKEVENKD